MYTSESSLNIVKWGKWFNGKCADVLTPISATNTEPRDGKGTEYADSKLK